MKRMLPTQDNCFGCSACCNICPKQCIQMKLNEYGELRPVVDENACVNCGKCSGVCPALSSPILHTPLDVYAMTLSDPDHKKGSASGGAARLLYEQAIKNGAVVYGCDFDEHHILRMKAARSLEDIEGFRNSKYTYCRMGNAFQEIRNFLKENVPVLFVGSSCQVDALQRYLGEKRDGLLTVDLICHGVPPEKYFCEYVDSKENDLHCKIDKVTFRGDTRAEDFHLRMYANKKCIYDTFARSDLFFAGYVNCIFFEEKCYSCPYATSNRVSDITIGDWGGASNFTAGKLSLLFLNTDKGRQYIENIIGGSDAMFESHTLAEALDCNEQLRAPSHLPDEYHEMQECYRDNDYQTMAMKYVQPLIKRYEFDKKLASVKRLFSLPIRVVRKIKRMAVKQ